MAPSVFRLAYYIASADVETHLKMYMKSYFNSTHILNVLKLRM